MEHNQTQQRQPQTSDDITKNQRTQFDNENMGEPVSIGNEDFEEDGGADLGFGGTDETEDKDRENPLRRSAPGGGTADGTNEGNYSGGEIGNLSGEFDTNSSSAGGSGTMRK